jgi:TetR/AcrR family transcriptional repressor of nem operon
MHSTIDTRQRLLDAAQELMYASSYREVGVQKICDHAGVRKGSFYHFFPSKHELALAVLDHTHALFKDALFSKAFCRDLPPLARIERFFAALYLPQAGQEKYRPRTRLPLWKHRLRDEHPG